jgi:hypothetical protein
VNRKKSMDLMISHAKSEANCQYIFITPQNMRFVISFRIKNFMDNRP